MTTCYTKELRAVACILTQRPPVTAAGWGALADRVLRRAEQTRAASVRPLLLDVAFWLWSCARDWPAAPPAAATRNAMAQVLLLVAGRVERRHRASLQARQDVAGGAA